MSDRPSIGVDFVYNGDARFGDWMQTHRGAKFWPLDPRSDEVDIGDIAHSLAHQCRYAGHCKKFYSVAEHSIIVSRLCKENKLSALLHDAAEAYLVDLPRPVKRFIPKYAEYEDALAKVIAEKFKLQYPWSEEIHEADRMAIAIERPVLMPSEYRWAGYDELVLPDGFTPVVGYTPEYAELVFLLEYETLTKNNISAH